MNDQEKKIIGYNPQTGEPIFEQPMINHNFNDAINQPQNTTNDNNQNLNDSVVNVESQSFQNYQANINNIEPVQNLNNNQQIYNQPVNQNTTEPINQTPAPTQNQYNNQGNITNNKNNKSKIWLIILIALGILFAIICSIITISSFKSNKSDEINLKSSTFYGDGYELEYDSRWEKTTVSTTDGGSKEALVYGNKEAYLLPLGVSSLSEITTESNIDFDTDSGKNKLYDEFYNYWNTSMNSEKLYGGSDGFKLLNDNVYYASMNYGTSSNNIKGKLYLVVSSDNNIIISFMSNINDDLNDNDERILEILKTINIITKYDDELANYLDSMSAWNLYSNLRQSTLGVKKDINGGWRILSDSETYWVFKNNEFWWYNSLYDLNDNYWYGTTRILTGKEGLKEVGLEEDKIDSIVANSSGKVTADNIYTIILTPSKIISEGVDKSSTNITGEDWHFVWIIVDHGSEGLEGQLLNVKTVDTSYYVKISD